MATLMESLAYKDWIIGVGFDSTEKDNPPSKFQKVCARAKAEGYLLTCHCDPDENNAQPHLLELMTNIGVGRIDHGANIADDTKLITTAVEKGIGLTWCPLSNTKLNHSSYEAKFLALRKAGIKVSINTDDPAYMQGYINANYLKIAQDVKLTCQNLADISKDGFAMSWLPAQTKEFYYAEVDAYVTQCAM